MTKENFINKWAFKYNVNYTTNPYFIDDLEAVIATEVAKAKEPQPENLKGNCSTFDMSRLVDQVQPAEQPTKPFDKERFERIFCAIVASGKTETWEQDFKGTIKTIEKLDAYYASKEGGANER